MKGGRVCSLQIANADCSFGRRAQLQGSAVRLQIADCKCSVQRAGLSCFCKGNPKRKPTKHPRAGPVCRSQIANADCSMRGRGELQGWGQGLQIPDCKYRLQHATERGAAEGQGQSADSRLQIQLQHTAERGAAETGMRCEKKTQITESVCRLQHLSLQMRSVRCHHSLISRSDHVRGGYIHTFPWENRQH